MSRKRSAILTRTRRTLALTQRALGDVNALQRGRLHKRLASRWLVRPLLRRWNHLWR